MKLVYLIGAGVVTVTGGMLLAWALDGESVEASIADGDRSVVATGNNGVQSARRAALSTFDGFWNRVSADSTGLDAISIKADVPHANGTEALWMTGCFSADAQSFECVVSNEPAHAALKLGARYRFERAAISDWMYREQGKIHGGYTIRALLPTLPPEEAKAMADMLAPPPG